MKTQLEYPLSFEEAAKEIINNGGQMIGEGFAEGVSVRWDSEKSALIVCANGEDTDLSPNLVSLFGKKYRLVPNKEINVEPTPMVSILKEEYIELLELKENLILDRVGTIEQEADWDAEAKQLREFIEYLKHS